MKNLKEWLNEASKQPLFYAKALAAFLVILVILMPK